MLQEAHPGRGLPELYSKEDCLVSRGPQQVRTEPACWEEKLGQFLDPSTILSSHTKLSVSSEGILTKPMCAVYNTAQKHQNDRPQVNPSQLALVPHNNAMHRGTYL